MARVLAVADLMFGSKVEATLSAAGHEVTLAGSLPAALDRVDLIVADLDANDPEALVGLGVPVLGYYSHVNVGTREGAVTAGVDLVVPRSRMAREMPGLVESLLGGA